MLFWMIVGGLALFAVAIFLAPLVRPPPVAVARSDYDIQFHRDQLFDLERDRAQGLIDSANTELARREIKRKLLAAEATQREKPLSPSRRHHAILAILALLVPALATLLYLDRGMPGMPDRPLAERMDQLKPGDIDGEALLLARVEMLRKRLQETPGNVDSLLQLGGVLLLLRKHEAAVEAYQLALRASGNQPDVASLLGEALVQSANGVVTESAHRNFEQVLADQPSDPRAQYYIALSNFQSGHYEQALTAWQALAAETPADAPWLGPLEAQIRAAVTALGQDGNVANVEARQTSPPGPDAAAIEAAQNMNADDRAAMIQTMIAQLASRLQDEPEDLDGWLRLAHAYKVLDDNDKAIEAYSRAATLAPQQIDVQVDYARAVLKTVDPSDILPERLITVMQAIEALDPNHPEALWFLGVADSQAGRKAAAAKRWQQLLSQLPPDGEHYALVVRELETLETAP